MDVVRTSAAGGIVAMAALVLVATGRPGLAQSAVELPAGIPSLSIQARIDEAFATSVRTAAFDVGGSVFPPLTDPVRPSTTVRASWPQTTVRTALWSAYVDEAAARFGLPAAWLHGVMRAESGGRTHLGGLPTTSPAGAMGLMQVMPTTFAEMRTRYQLGPDPYDPRTNILAGAAYLREMYDRYGPRHFLAAYNAGPARVDAWLRGRAELPSETRAYTATLVPQLGLDLLRRPASSATGVQDLTSLDAMRALVAPSSRPFATRVGDGSHAPVLVQASTARSTPDRRHVATPPGGLFVVLTAADRRREASALAHPSE